MSVQIIFLRATFLAASGYKNLSRDILSATPCVMNFSWDISLACFKCKAWTRCQNFFSDDILLLLYIDLVRLNYYLFTVIYNLMEKQANKKKETLLSSSEIP